MRLDFHGQLEGAEDPRLGTDIPILKRKNRVREAAIASLLFWVEFLGVNFHRLCGRGWRWTGMTKRKHVSPDASLLPKKRKPIPHAFVLDAISTLSPYTRPMFGCLAIYVKDKIVLILRDKPANAADNGVWLATTQEHHQSLRHEFPNMRSIQVLGKRVTGWQVLPVDAPDFESAALRACELVLAGDARIGKIPGARTSKSGSKAAGRSPKQVKTSKKHGSTINFDRVRKIGLALLGVEE